MAGSTAASGWSAATAILESVWSVAGSVAGNTKPAKLGVSTAYLSIEYSNSKHGFARPVRQVENVVSAACWRYDVAGGPQVVIAYDS